jgi:hypothetical protein
MWVLMAEPTAKAVANLESAVWGELADDGVELWSLFRYTHRELPSASTGEVMEVVEQVLQNLIDGGVRVGEIDYKTGNFSYWNEDAPLGRVMAEVRALGREPNVGDMAWLVKDVLP